MERDKIVTGFDSRLKLSARRGEGRFMLLAIPTHGRSGVGGCMIANLKVVYTADGAETDGCMAMGSEAV